MLNLPAVRRKETLSLETINLAVLFGKLELFIISMKVNNCTNIRVKVSVILYANYCANCYQNFNPSGIFEKMTSFSPILNQELEQEKLMAAVYSRK